MAPALSQAWADGSYLVEAINRVGGGGVTLPRPHIDQVGRTSVYNQQAVGNTEGDGWAASGEVGWHIPVGGFSLTPFATVDYVDLDLDGYAERGASVSNVTYADRSFSQLTASFGGEIGIELGAIRPAIRGGYSFESESGDKSTAVRLTSAQHRMGAAILTLAETERDTAFGEVRIGMRDGAISGYVSGRGRWGRGEDDARVSLGVGYAF